MLGQEERAASLADYGEQALRNVAAALKDLPEEQKLTVYYAESPDGLATDCDGSFHAEAIKLAGGANVYHCKQHAGSGQDRVGLDQVILFHPARIVAQDATFVKGVGQDIPWQDIPAVRDGKVVAIPHTPFNWVDRPPSYVRFLGVQWLANWLYPDRFPLDLKAETRKFYHLAYGVDLTDQDFEAIIP